MGILGDIIIIILLLIIFYFQREKIGSLEKQIVSQKDILNSAKTFFDFFDLEKLRGYAEIREEKIRTEKEIELNKIKVNFEERIRKGEYATGFLINEYITVIRAFFDALYKLPRIRRREVISRIGEGVFKRSVEEANKQVEEAEGQDMASALLALKRGLEGG